MTTKTQAQRDSDAELERAITAVCTAYGLLREKVMLDYVVVIEGASFDDGGEVDEEYFGLAFRHGNARTSVALGLLTKGHDLLLTGARDEGDRE